MSDRTEAMFEILDDKLDSLIEIIKPMQADINMLKEKVSEIDEIKQDIKVIKAAVTDTSHQVHDHERRITHLEAAA